MPRTLMALRSCSVLFRSQVSAEMSAFSMVKVRDAEPEKVMPLPVSVTVAVPLPTLFSYETE